MVKLEKSQILQWCKDNKPEYEILDIEHTQIGINNKRKYHVLHVRCERGHDWKTEFTNFQGHNCPICVREKGFPHLQKYTKDFVNRFCEENNIELLDSYKDTSTPVRYKCKNCGHIATSDFRHLVNGRKCAKCLGLTKKTTEQFSQEVNDRTDGEYTVVGEYINANTKIAIRHSICGHVNEVTPCNFLKGKRCPICNQSHGESEVAKFLDNNNLTYARQFKFDDCRNLRPLPFDFAIMDTYGNPYILIEYQGRQHYEPIDYFGGVEGLEYRLRNDEIKRQYCENNNIKLLEIKYSDSRKINTILQDELNIKKMEEIQS